MRKQNEVKCACGQWISWKEYEENGDQCPECGAEQDAIREMALEDEEFFSPNIGCK